MAAEGKAEENEKAYANKSAIFHMIFSTSATHTSMMICISKA
jgi:hypothetical protein